MTHNDYDGVIVVYRRILALLEEDSVSEEQATLVVWIKRWFNHHTILLGPVIEVLKEDDALKEISWPHIDILDIDTDNLDDITIPMPSAYPPEVQQHSLFKSFVIAEGKILEGKANNILQQL